MNVHKDRQIATLIADLRAIQGSIKYYLGIPVSACEVQEAPAGRLTMARKRGKMACGCEGKQIVSGFMVYVVIATIGPTKEEKIDAIFQEEKDAKKDIADKDAMGPNATFRIEPWAVL